MLRQLFSSVGLSVLIASAGCHSESANSPESSSSSHWFVCSGLAQCDSAPGAVACSQGYCVDEAGERIRTDAESKAPVSTLDASESRDAAAGDAGMDGESLEAEVPPSPTDAGAASDASDSGPRTSDAGVGVLVIGGRGPAATIRVVFHDQQGNLLSDQLTNGDGIATTNLAASMMTVYHPTDFGNGHATTFVGVEPGDMVRAQGPWPQFFETRTLYTLDIPPAPAGSALRVVGGQEDCPIAGTATDAGMIVPNNLCLHEGTEYALLAWVDNATSFANFPGFSWVTQVHAPKPTDPPIPLSFTAWEPARACVISVRNMPALSADSASLWMRNGDNIIAGPSLAPGIWPYAPGFSQDLEASTFTGLRAFRKRVAPADRIEFDANGTLPIPQLAPLERLDNPPRIRLRWTMPDSSTKPYAAYIALDSNGGNWGVFVPPELREITLPVPPGPFGLTTFSLENAKQHGIIYMAGDTIADYRDFLRRPEYGLGPLRKRGQAESAGSLLAE